MDHAVELNHPESCRYVEQIMTSPVFTVRADDRVQRAADLMEWKHIRHVPVEDETGRLVGVVTYRTLLHLLAMGRDRPVPVGEVMKAFPMTVFPRTPSLEALQIMRETGVGCLPVVDPSAQPSPKLIGILTGSDFVTLSAQLLDEWLRD
jgi:CBS domain-containing protein